MRDDGDKLQVSRKVTRESLREALQLAIARYGNRITINGTNKFKERVVQVAVFKIPLTFTDPFLENQRQQLLIKESKNDQHNHRRTYQRGWQSWIRSAISPNVSRAETEKSSTSLPSQTLASLDETRHPKAKTVCEHCPNSVWFASPVELKCYCRVMYLVTWSSQEPSQITHCDGESLNQG